MTDAPIVDPTPSGPPVETPEAPPAPQPDAAPGEVIEDPAATPGEENAVETANEQIDARQPVMTA